MTKVMRMLLLRYFFFIFGVLNGFVPLVLEVVGWIAALGIHFSFVMGLCQSIFDACWLLSSVAR